MKRLLIVSAILLLVSTMAARAAMLLGAQTQFSQGGNVDVLAQAKDAGLPISFVRDEMFWKNVERSPGVLNSSEYDPYFNAIRAQGYKLLLELFNTNPLYDGNKFPASDAAQAAFVKYAEFLVQKYGDGLVAVELWNEPNGAGGYGYDYKTLAPIYARLAKKVYTAVKAIRPDLPVLVSASVLFQFSWQQLLVDNGLLAYSDGWSIHPYVNPNDPNDLDALFKRLREIIGSKPIWVTEWGVNRHSTTFGDPTRYIRKALAIYATNGVQAASWFLLRDKPPSLATQGLIPATGPGLTDQGVLFKEMQRKIVKGTVTRGVSSALVPWYKSSTGYRMGWVQAAPGSGTLGGHQLGPVPYIRSGGVFVETTQ